MALCMFGDGDDAAPDDDQLHRAAAEFLRQVPRDGLITPPPLPSTFPGSPLGHDDSWGRHLFPEDGPGTDDEAVEEEVGSDYELESHAHGAAGPAVDGDDAILAAAIAAVKRRERHCPVPAAPPVKRVRPPPEAAAPLPPAKPARPRAPPQRLSSTRVRAPSPLPDEEDAAAPVLRRPEWTDPEPSSHRKKKKKAAKAKEAVARTPPPSPLVAPVESQVERVAEQLEAPALDPEPVPVPELVPEPEPTPVPTPVEPAPEPGPVATVASMPPVGFTWETFLRQVLPPILRAAADALQQ